MAWHDDLPTESPVYRIASDDRAAIRVLAGPGTGKSFAIKRRITRLLESGAAPDRILAVTFTNMSADDLVRDIRGLRAPGAERVHARTLHSQCLRILNSNAVIEITGRHPRTLASYERAPLIADLAELGPIGDVKGIRKAIHAYEAAWARLQHENPIEARSADDLSFEVELIEWMGFHRCMLIGEIIPFAYRYLRDNPAATERAQYEHVLVDEYQDLNRAEQEVAKLLASAGSLIVVGDDDQSIYTFKHAHADGIIEFTNAHPGSGDHTLAECHRCPGRVVSMANSLIAVNRHRSQPPRQLTARPANGPGDVAVYQFATDDAEANYLAELIKRRINNDGLAPGQIIVLSTTRHLARKLLDALEYRRIPCRFCFQEAELDEDEAARSISLLRLLAQPEDRVSLRYLLGFGSANWRAPQWCKLRALCTQSGLTPRQALEQMRTGERPSTGFAQLLGAYRQVADQLASLQGPRGAELRDAIIGVDADRNRSLRAYFNELLLTNPDASAEAAAEYLIEAVTQPEVPEAVEDVRIMSLHKSKGLSAHMVIIMGCMEGALPRAMDQSLPEAEQAKALEEQRRLFYVGLTRVKAEPSRGIPGYLVLSSCRRVEQTAGHRSQLQAAGRAHGAFRAVASRFLAELGPDAPQPINPA